MTNVNQISEPFITHHSVDDQPLTSFSEAISIFQKHFPVVNPIIRKEQLVYDNFSSLGFANAYRKLAHNIIVQHNLPLEATAHEHLKTKRIQPLISSVERLSTTVIITYKP